MNVILKNKICSICGEYKSKLIKCECGIVACISCSNTHECLNCLMEKEKIRVLETYPQKDNKLKWIQKSY